MEFVMDREIRAKEDSSARSCPREYSSISYTVGRYFKINV